MTKFRSLNIADSEEEEIVSRSEKDGSSSDSISEQEDSEKNQLTQEDMIDLEELKGDGFISLFKRPKNGSILAKLRKGDLSGKNAGHQWENIAGDFASVMASKKCDRSFYFIGRMVMGHLSATELAEKIGKLKLADPALNDDILIRNLTNGEVNKWDDLGDFMRGLLPYYKDVVSKHKGFFSRFIGT